MKRSWVPACVVAAAAAAGLLHGRATAQERGPLGGLWTLNRSLSEMPQEIGFDLNWIAPPTAGGQSGGSGAGSSGGGRGRRGSGGGSTGGRSGSGFAMPRESYDEARRVQLLTAEARNPAARLMIVDTTDAVTITNELGQSRTLHPSGKEESIEIQGVPISVTSKRDGDRLVVDYFVQQGREVRYTYSHPASPPQLIVEVQFIEKNAGDKARRVYEPGVATESAATAPARAAGSVAAGDRPAEGFDARPGAELKGIKSLGILVEELSTRAVACGLNRDALEGALSKRLTDGGFTVRRNSDEDTYVYVNVMTNTMSDGTCVSRYDAFLYTHTTAKLAYHDQPVLVQVSLMHRGGLGSSAPTGHAAAVARGLEGYIDLFATQIHDANK
jgi:hypothetical protein